MGSSILLVAPFTFSPQLSHQYYTMSHSSFMKNCFILTALIAMIWMPVALTQNPCPDGWEWNPNLSKCYYIIYTYTTWSEANVMCAALDPEGKATLTSIRSLEENDYILSLIPYVSWIGGTDTAEEGVWRWVEDNSLVDDSFTNWGQACPHDSESKNCMWSSGGGNIGTWFDEACTSNSYAICSKPIVTQNPCPDGWEWNPNLSKCYYIIYTYTTWSEANVMCAALDPEGKATLTSIRSMEENDYILSLISYVSWIGGTDAAEEGVWRWVEDDSLVDASFTNWGLGCPRDSESLGESLNCMWSSIGGYIGTWYDESCKSVSYAIC